MDMTESLNNTENTKNPNNTENCNYEKTLNNEKSINEESINYEIPIIKDTIREYTSTFCKKEIPEKKIIPTNLNPENILTLLIKKDKTYLIKKDSIILLEIYFDEITEKTEKLKNKFLNLKEIENKFVNLVFYDTFNLKELLFLLDCLFLKCEGVFLCPYSVFITTALGLSNSLVSLNDCISLTEDCCLIETVNERNEKYEMIDFRDEFTQNFRPFICKCNEICENSKHFEKHTKSKKSLEENINENKKENLSLKENYKIIENKNIFNKIENVLFFDNLPEFIEFDKNRIKIIPFNNENIEIYEEHLIFYDNKMNMKNKLEYEGINLLNENICNEIDLLLISSVIYRFSEETYELFILKKEYENFGLKKVKESILFFI